MLKKGFNHAKRLAVNTDFRIEDIKQLIKSLYNIPTHQQTLKRPDAPPGERAFMDFQQLGTGEFKDTRQVYMELVVDLKASKRVYQPIAHNDRPNGPDHLGYATYAEALAGAVVAAAPPLTVGICTSRARARLCVYGLLICVPVCVCVHVCRCVYLRVCVCVPVCEAVELRADGLLWP